MVQCSCHPSLPSTLARGQSTMSSTRRWAGSSTSLALRQISFRAGRGYVKSYTERLVTRHRDLQLIARFDAILALRDEIWYGATYQHEFGGLLRSYCHLLDILARFCQ